MTPLYDTSKKQTAFTIVELLIVIVVIGVLAAITIVAYNGIQSRARSSAASSALTQAAKKIAVWQVDNPSSTPDCATFSSFLSVSTTTCTPTTSDVAYQYTAGTNGAYCVTATVGTTSYYLNTTSTTQGTPTSGGCAGHGVGGQSAITNFNMNPSAEGSLAGYSGPNGSTLALTSAKSNSGSSSILVTVPTANAGYTGVNTTLSYNVPSNLSASTTYTFSLWVYVLAGTVDIRLSAQGAGVASSTCGSNTATSTKDTWVRLSCALTTTASGGLALYALTNANSTAGMQFYADSVMYTEGTTLYNYADGSSANWVWNGTANNATSTGPPI
jgi:prepilin-type N-terminal cleavage/methylation domain-containing protein